MAAEPAGWPAAAVRTSQRIGPLKCGRPPSDDQHMTLAGLGLFTRATPQPTSIAVHLGLTPSARHRWAWRVSVRLRHAGPDGLTRHVGEIERLAALGRSVLAAVPDAVWAGAVTAAGSRTWLCYSPADGGGVDLNAADYPTTVAHEPDPEWAGYRAISPTPAEAADLLRRRAEGEAVVAARTATHETVRSLRTAGIDLTRSATVAYRVTIPAEADLLWRASAEGLRVEPGPPTRLCRDDLPDLALILRTERWLIRETTRAGGRYDGWSVVGVN